MELNIMNMDEKHKGKRSASDENAAGITPG